MLTSSQVLEAIAPARFALAERAGLPDGTKFTGQVFLPHGIFWGRVVELPMITPSLLTGPLIMGVVCFRVTHQVSEDIVDVNKYVEVYVTFDHHGRPVASDATTEIRQYHETCEFTQPDMLIHDCNAAIHIMENEEPVS
jgi:hypothetical protein